MPGFNFGQPGGVRSGPGAANVRPPREGLPPFPTGRGESPPGVFSRVPPELRGRPVPDPPDIPSPGVLLRTGERVNKSSLFDPVNVLAYGGVGVAVYLLAAKSRASGEEPPKTGAAGPGANVGVDPSLIPPRMSEENARRANSIEAARERLNAVVNELDDFLFGQVESAAAKKVITGGGAAKRSGAFLAKDLFFGGGLGAGEEDALSREADARRTAREQLARALLAGLSVSPPLAGGGPAVEMLPMWQADP